MDNMGNKEYKQKKEKEKSEKKFKLFTKRNMIIGVLGLNVILIPFCIIYSVDLPSVASVILTLVLFIVYNTLSMQISRYSYLYKDKKITKELEAKIIRKDELKKVFGMSVLINLPITILYLILVLARH